MGGGVAQAIGTAERKKERLETKVKSCLTLVRRLALMLILVDGVCACWLFAVSMCNSQARPISSHFSVQSELKSQMTQQNEMMEKCIASCL